MADTPHTVQQETPASLRQLQLNIYTKWVRCLYTFATTLHCTGHVLRAAFNWHRRQRVDLIKTSVLLLSSPSIGPLFFYFKQAANDAWCQLRLAERKYREVAVPTWANSRECQFIPREGNMRTRSEERRV